MSNFKSQVKHKLIDLDKNQSWLIEQVNLRGVFLDSSYLNKLYKGQRNGEKTKQIICEVLNIDYDRTT